MQTQLHSKSQFNNYYNILGINSDSEFKEIKKGYFQQAKLCHPDLFNNAKDKEEEFKLLVLAFDTLSDPLKRVTYDELLGIEQEVRAQSSKNINNSVSFSIMDLPSDDILEEFIVGNSPPPNAHIATLFLDLASTEVFMTFREGKNLFYLRKYSAATLLFKRVIKISPHNILYHYYLARSLAFLQKFSSAKRHYNIAIKIGQKRIPRQYLRRIKSELKKINKKHFPIWNGIVNLFINETPDSSLSTEEGMIASANRVIEQIMSEDKKKAQKKIATSSSASTKNTQP